MYACLSIYFEMLLCNMKKSFPCSEVKLAYSNLAFLLALEEPAERCPSMDND